MADSPDLLVPGRMLHPPGIVGIPCGEQARWAEFTRCLTVLERPKNSGLSFVYGTYIQALRNELVNLTLDSHAQWLFMVDDDHTFDRSLLINLLDRHVPVVGAAAVSRKPPYYVCAYAPDAEHALGLTEFEPIFQPVDVVGTGAILIRRDVLEGLEPPWFEVGYDENGRNVSEDANFCKRAREAGFGVWLDGTQTVGHLTGVALSVGEVGLVIELDHEQSIVIPREQIDERVEAPGAVA